MKTPIILLLVAVLSASCTKNPPLLDSQKELVHNFRQPERKALSGTQSKQLGKPAMKSLGKKSSTYYSANGNLCRRLSNSKIVCHIGGRWYESVAIRAIR